MSEAVIPLALLLGWLAAILWHTVREDRRGAASHRGAVEISSDAPDSRGAS